MQNYITMQSLREKVRRSAVIGGGVVPTRSAPTV